MSEPLRHTVYETARFFISRERQSYANVATSGPWASKVFGDFIKADVSVLDLK